MHILITGGTGFVGRHLIERLWHDHQLTVLTRDKERASKLLPGQVKIIKSLAEIADFGQLDAVINLAGEPIADKRWSALQKKRICDSRWEITRELVTRINACQTPPGIFLSGSAIGYYGRQGDRTVTELDNQPNPEFTHELCARWENIACEAKNEQTRVCLLRTGVVLAKGEGALAKMAPPVKLFVGGKMGSGEQYLSWIHIDDMVSALLFLLENEHCHGPYNMTAPHPQTNKAFTDTLARAMHRPNVFTVPGFALKLMMGEAADMLLTGQKVIPERLQHAGFTFSYPNLQDALNYEFG
ncbi:TIGR01777 family oxidoreductase [Salinimonas lutimaris]|uniref:TIGR01777 family oxidoreductase n=1 Tax=Salinimonas lutimaris TaxID=914153 RepID=UPI0010C01C5E|nr:TIGR01777 family oxidoreductase [Salinimonas lutimaris]